MSTDKAAKTVLAFLIAPLIVPFVLLFLSLLPLPGQDHSRVVNPMGLLTGLLYFAFFGLPCAYVTEVLVGIPAWLVFRRYGICSWLAFAAGGAVIGLVFYFATDVLTYLFSPSMRQFNISSNSVSNPYLYIDVIAATASGVLFRFIVFCGKRCETSN